MADLAAREIELPDEQTAKQSEDAVRRLSGLSVSASVQLVISNDASEPGKVDLPQKAVRIIVDALAELGKGNAVAVVPVHPELYPQEAADILNVSLSYMVGLLDEGKIPHRMVHNRRRVPLKCLLEYKRIDDAYRESVLDELTREAERTGGDYY